MFTKELFLDPFLNLWERIVTVLPSFILALLVFIIGCIIAKLVYKAITKLSQTIKLNQLGEPIISFFERSGYKLDLGKLIGFLFKWFFIIGSLIISLEILGLSGVVAILSGIVTKSIPQVIIAILILVAGITLADFVKKLVKGSTKMLNVKSAGLLSNIARVIIIVFTVLITLDVIGVNSMVTNVLFIGIIAMFAIAGGLAFGLGGQRAAAELVDDIKNSLNK